jgi:hypothetical protein
MKIFFDTDHIINDKFCSEQVLMIPFLSNEFIQTNVNFEDVNDYKEIMSKDVQLTDLDSCDFILYPNKFDNSLYLKDYIEMAKDTDKLLVVFYNDDNESPAKELDVDYTIFRTSFDKGNRKGFEKALPAWSKDFKKYKDIPIRPKEQKPVIGFCGAITHQIRSMALDQFKHRDPQYITNFLIRNQFWGGNPDDPSLRMEFIDNTIDSDFVICARGAGNFSYRLYETLSAGRIPIFIDSNTPVPFEDHLKLDQYFPVVKQDEICNITDIVLNFWNRIDDYNILQESLRSIYENYFSPYGFTHQLNKL